MNWVIGKSKKEEKQNKNTIREKSNGAGSRGITGEVKYAKFVCMKSWWCTEN